MRVGVVELGSGSIRYVVVDVPRNSSFEILQSDGTVYDLINVGENGHSAEQYVARAAQIASHYVLECKYAECDRIIAITTAPGRCWNRVVQKQFRAALPTLIFLSAEQEAWFAVFAATLLNNSAPVPESIQVLDVGKGSDEFAVGCRCAHGVDVDRMCSWPAGSLIGSTILRNSGSDLRRAIAGIADLLPDDLPIAAHPTAIALGTCVVMSARLADLSRRRSRSLRNINGAVLSTGTVDSQVRWFVADDAAFRSSLLTLDPVVDTDVQIAGTVILQALCHKLRLTALEVSTYGIRFAVAVCAARGLGGIDELT